MPGEKCSYLWMYNKNLFLTKIKIGFQDRLWLNESQKYCRMHPLEHSAILSTIIRQPFVMKIFVWSIFEWQLKTGSTVMPF